MSKESLVRSAVVLLDTADEFILQRRPNLLGRLAYPGKLQFLGGGVEGDETGPEAAARELREETNLDIPPTALEEYWHGEYEGLDKQGHPVLRDVTLCHLGLTALGADSLRLREQGELARVGKLLEAVESNDELTPFARDMLVRYLKDKR